MLLALVASPPSLCDAIRVYYVSSFQGVVLPLGGLGPDIVRYAHLRSSQISAHAVGVSIVMERVIGLLATVSMALAATGVLAVKVGANEEVTSLLLWVSIGGVAGFFALVGVLFSRELQRRVHRLLQRIKPVAEHSSFVRIVHSLSEYSSAPRALLTNLGLSIAEQMFSVMAFYFATWAFDMPVSFVMCVAVIPFASLVERLPISYMGVGIREGVIVFLLGVMGVAYPSALVLSTTVFAVFLISLIPGFIMSISQTDFRFEKTGKGKGNKF